MIDSLKAHSLCYHKNNDMDKNVKTSAMIQITLISCIVVHVVRWIASTWFHISKFKFISFLHFQIPMFAVVVCCVNLFFSKSLKIARQFCKKPNKVTNSSGDSGNDFGRQTAAGKEWRLDLKNCQGKSLVLICRFAYKFQKFHWLLLFDRHNSISLINLDFSWLDHLFTKLFVYKQSHSQFFTVL